LVAPVGCAPRLDGEAVVRGRVGRGLGVADAPPPGEAVSADDPVAAAGDLAASGLVVAPVWAAAPVVVVAPVVVEVLPETPTPTAAPPLTP
jgi:hypothetical protein